jgi:hypothetical protein
MKDCPYCKSDVSHLRKEGRPVPLLEVYGPTSKGMPSEHPLYYVHCHVCYAEGPLAGTSEEAVTLWNKRFSNFDEFRAIRVLTRAYRALSREGWEEGPNDEEARDAIHNFLCDIGEDPNEQSHN